MSVCHFLESSIEAKPILISVPHCGINFPSEVEDEINHDLLPPDDTDFFVHKLYDFAPDMGISIIHANFSRWVIDLNRDPESKPLYSDGRIITGLVPETDFLGNKLYRTSYPNQEEIKRRIKNYYTPYHEAIRKQLEALRLKFNHVLLFDAHSIRKSVPTINPSPFPDLILGDDQGKSANLEIINTSWEVLNSSQYSSSHNTPFQGGYITRSFGQPKNKIHALQLEMAKINYMDDSESEYHIERAGKMRVLLKSLFQKLIAKLEDLNQSDAL